jgi:3-oxoadipate enol-lactonase
MHHARQLHDGIPGSRLVVIEDGDHALIWAMPDAFVDAVASFLDD